MRSNLWSSLAQASAMAVVLLNMQTHLSKNFHLGTENLSQSPWNLGKIASWHDSRRLVVDANLEACGAPVNELDRPKVSLIYIHFALLFHQSLALSMSLDPDFGKRANMATRLVDWLFAWLHKREATIAIGKRRTILK